MLYTLRDVSKRHHREHGYRLHIRSLCIPRGARLAITGPSGCGKSTTLDMLGLALQPDDGATFLFTPPHATVDILELWRHGRNNAMASLRLQHMGYVLQTGELLPFLTVAENMTLTARMAGMAPADALESARSLADQLGIAPLLTAMPSTLSVGERQRAAIVRALTPRPHIILADEPTAALDPYHAARVMEAFLKALDAQGGTLILVTHNRDWAREGGLCEVPFLLETHAEGVTAVLDNSAQTAPSDHKPEEDLPC